MKTINHTTNVTGNKTESASIDMNIDQNVTVEIIGDSILNGLVDRIYLGCTTRDLKHHVLLTIEKKPSVIVNHAGTNDLTNDVETIANYKYIIEIIKKKSPHTKIAISLLTLRKDRKNIENMIIKLNNEIRELCAESLIGFIAHDCIEESCIGFKNKLHLNKKGNAYLANNFINYIKSLY